MAILNSACGGDLKIERYAQRLTHRAYMGEASSYSWAPVAGKKYHNILCVPSKLLHKLSTVSSFFWDLTMVPRKNKNNAYAKVWRQTKSITVFCGSGLDMHSDPAFSLMRKPESQTRSWLERKNVWIETNWSWKVAISQNAKFQRNTPWAEDFMTIWKLENSPLPFTLRLNFQFPFQSAKKRHKNSYTVFKVKGAKINKQGWKFQTSRERFYVCFKS